MKALFLASLLLLIAGCTQPGDIAKAYLSGLDKDVQIVSTTQLACEGCTLVALHSPLHTYGVVVVDGSIVQATRDGTFDLLEGGPIKQDAIVYFCDEDRSQACTKELRPVCADGKRQFANGCVACANSSVKWYAQGECADGYFETVYEDLQAGRITGESGPALVVVGWNIES